MPRLRRRDYALPADELAPRLLGHTLVRLLDGTRLAGVIVETEAYLGPEDRAAHSYNNRRTPRTEPMFGPAGTSYVYFTYGMHHCMNIAAAEVGVPQAVLIRALEPTEGLDTMRAHRATPRRPVAALRPADLCSGPAKLCQALAIDRSLTGLDLTASDQLWVEAPARDTTTGSGFLQIHTGTRIGVGYAGAWARRHLRYFLCGHPHVSSRRTGGRPWKPQGGGNPAGP